jgi:hypothetical protein
MPTTPKNALPYPSLDAENNPPRFIQELAEALDDLVRPMVRKNVVVQTDSDGRATISFGHTFDDVPIVLATGGNGELVSVKETTTSGFTAEFRNFAASFGGNTLIVNGPVRVFYSAGPESL